MALTSGARLGPYEIQLQPGAGGMGEVYVRQDGDKHGRNCRSLPTATRDVHPVLSGRISGNLLATITLQTRPTGVAVNATTNKIYVGDGNEINVIDGTTNSIVDTIAVAASVVVVNPTTNTIYAVENGNIAVIDGTTGLVTATISAPSPAALAVDTQTNFIYVANPGNYDFNQHGSVTVINGATNATTTTLTDSNMPYPFRIAVNSTTNKIYVASILSNNITVIDGTND